MEEILDFTVWCGTILVLSGEHIVALMIGEMVLYNSNECCTLCFCIPNLCMVVYVSVMLLVLMCCIFFY